MKWIPANQPPPIDTASGKTWLGYEHSKPVIVRVPYKDAKKAWYVCEAVYLYDPESPEVYSASGWYQLLDNGNDLDRIDSHGYPAPTHWIEMPEDP